MASVSAGTYFVAAVSIGYLDRAKVWRVCKICLKWTWKALCTVCYATWKGIVRVVTWPSRSWREFSESLQVIAGMRDPPPEYDGFEG